MSPHHLPGWELPNGHTVRSHMEAALCEYLAARGIPHHHGILPFEVEAAPDRRVSTFIPEIVLAEDKIEGRAVIIESLASNQPGGGVRRLAAFRRQYRREYFLIVVAKRVLRPHLPEEAYDALVPLEDFGELDRLLARTEL